MAEGLSRAAILPEPALLDAGALIAEGRRLAASATVGRSAFLDHYGVVLDYLDRLGHALAARGRDVPIFVGGKLNRIPDASNTSLPVEVSAEIADAGATPCRRIEDLLAGLATLARSRL